MTRSIYRRPWRIDVDVRERIVVPGGVAPLVRAIAAALDAARASGATVAPASIGLILADDRELGTLNATHMGKAGPTDVLSFPLLPPEAFARGAGVPADPRPPGSRLPRSRVDCRR